jgi:hypothetical protein
LAREWDATGRNLNRQMNKAHRENGVLAEHIRKAVRSKARCNIEIRTVAGSQSREAAERLAASLRLGGLQAEIVETGSSPRGDILIESSQECASIALSLQSAFLAWGASVQVLVHEKIDPRTIVLHIGEQAGLAAL